MGNRAVITTRENYENNGVGVYLHWNGGRDSVSAFLKYCKLRGFRTGSYGWARLCQIIGNFFGGSLSIGIDTVDCLDCDNGDNGVYLIADWEIVGREHFDYNEQNSYDETDTLLLIDSKQPESERLGEEFIKCGVWPTSCLIEGDLVYITREDHEPQVFEVVGIGKENTVVGGVNVGGIPFINRYGPDYRLSINNYLRDESYRVKNRETPAVEIKNEGV
jgi:hypothetical protein